MKLRIILMIAVLLLLFTEIFLRVFISKPSTQQYDEILGYTNIPGSKMIESMEGYSHITFNSLGFNDDEPIKSIKRKIFVIGDSYTEAFQVNRSNGYVALIDKVLNKNNIDTIKLARDSFVPLHYPLISNRYYRLYSPEFTILQLGSHTLSDLYGEDFSISYGGNNKIVSYTLKVSDNDKKKNSIRGIINNSALAYYLLRKYKYLILGAVHKIDWFKRLFLKNDSARLTTKKTANKKRNDEQRLSYILKKIPGPVIVVYFPDPGINTGNNIANDKVRKIIKQASNNAGVNFIDLTDDFKSDFHLNSRLLNGFSNSKPGAGHLNKQGHSFVANKIIYYLNSLRIINTK